MTYGDLVKAERRALASLQRRLREWGNGKRLLASVRAAWNEWSALAMEVEARGDVARNPGPSISVDDADGGDGL